MRSLSLVLALCACKGQIPSDDKALVQGQIDEMLDRMEQLEARLAVQNTELMATTTELKATRDELAATQADLEATQALYDEATARLDGHDQDLEDLRTDMAALSGGITFTDLSDQLNEHADRLTSIEGAGYATVPYVDATGATLQAELASTTAAQLLVDDAQSSRLTAIEGAGYVSGSWVLAQNYADTTLTTANGDAIAALDGRVETLENTDLATETWVHAQTYASEAWVEGNAYATQASLDTTNNEVGTLTGRVLTLENAEYTTRTWIEAQGFLNGDDYTVLDDAIVTLGQTDVAHDARIGSLEGAGFATTTEVEAVGARVTTLESAGLATEAWVMSQSYASAADASSNGDAITAVDLRLLELESTDLATETWVGEQEYATETWVQAQTYATQEALAATDASVSSVGGRVTSLENAGYTTRTWIESQGFLDGDDYTSLDGRVSTLETAGYATIGDVGAVSDRVSTLENAGYATSADVGAVDARITGVAGDLDTLTGRVDAADSSRALLDGRITANTDTIEGVSDRVNTLENAGYASIALVDAVNGRVSAVQSEVDAVEGSVAVLDTRVTGNAADLDAVRGRVSTLENAGYATIALVDAVDGRVTALGGRVTTLENAGYASDADLLAVGTRVGMVEDDLDLVTARVSDNESAGSATDAALDALAIRVDTQEDGLADLSPRLTDAEDDLAGLTTRVGATEAGLNGARARLTTLENAGYASEADVVAVAGRVSALEGADYATNTRVDGVANRVNTLENAGYASDADVVAVATRVDMLEDADDVTSVRIDSVSSRVTTLENAGYTTRTWIEAQGFLDGDNELALQATDAAINTRVTQVAGRVSTLENAGYTTAADLRPLDARLDATELATTTNELGITALESRTRVLENAGFIDEAWVLSQNYATTSDTMDLQDQLDALDYIDDLELDAALATVETEVSDIDDRVGTIESSYATRSWVNGRGFLTEVPWTIGNGLRVVDDTLVVNAGTGLEFAGGTLRLDEAEVEGLATDVCYDTPAELLNALDGEYVLAGNTINADGGVQFGDDATTCASADDVGIIRFHNGAFEGCTASGWTPFATMRDGLTSETPGTSCAQILESFPASPSAVYWLEGMSGSIFEAYCDMTTDGGGWTLVGTIAGGDENNWNTQYGYWSNDAVLGHAENPWMDHKSRAWIDMDVSTSEVLFQRRYDNAVRGRAKLSNACLFGVTRFGDLFSSWDTSLRCDPSEITVLNANAAGVTSSDYREGAVSGLGGAGTNGFCWNGGDTAADTFMGHAGWNPASQGCLAPNHLGYIGVWQSGASHNNLDVDNTTWLNGVDVSFVEVSFFVR